MHTVRTICDELREAGLDESSASRECWKFLLSDDVARAPEIHISALIYAAVAGRAGRGQGRVPSRGFIMDVRTISAYLPYCDAMFVDNECRGLLAEDRVKNRLGFSTRAFSARTWEDFLAFLDSIEAACSEDHRRLVREVYGDDWEKPFETLYETRSA